MDRKASHHCSLSCALPYHNAFFLNADTFISWKPQLAVVAVLVIITLYKHLF